METDRREAVASRHEQQPTSFSTVKLYEYLDPNSRHHHWSYSQSRWWWWSSSSSVFFRRHFTINIFLSGDAWARKFTFVAVLMDIRVQIILWIHRRLISLLYSYVYCLRTRIILQTTHLMILLISHLLRSMTHNFVVTRPADTPEYIFLIMTSASSQRYYAFNGHQTVTSSFVSHPKIIKFIRALTGHSESGSENSWMSLVRGGEEQIDRSLSFVTSSRDTIREKNVLQTVSANSPTDCKLMIICVFEFVTKPLLCWHARNSSTRRRMAEEATQK